MACNNPQLVKPNGLTKNGKTKYRFLGSIDKNKELYDRNFNADIETLPCGRCIECRLQYSREHATRGYFEMLSHEHTYFLTLTYDNMHVPRGKNNQLTLRPPHLTKFIKDLRRYYDYHFKIQGIRFFACGEYGDKTQRPHYHVILYGCPIENKVYHSTNPRTKDVYYENRIINDIWGRGMVIIGDCSWKSVAYVARYIVKKKYGMTSLDYVRAGITPEFVRMSRNPGIAHKYFKDNLDHIYRYDSVQVFNGKESVTIKPPRFADKLLEKYNPSLFTIIKEIRNSKKDVHLNHIRAVTSKEHFDYLEDRQDVSKNNIKKLPRLAV